MISSPVRFLNGLTGIRHRRQEKGMIIIPPYLVERDSREESLQLDLGTATANLSKVPERTRDARGPSAASARRLCLSGTFCGGRALLFRTLFETFSASVTPPPQLFLSKSLPHISDLSSFQHQFACDTLRLTGVILSYTLQIIKPFCHVKVPRSQVVSNCPMR